MKGPLAERLPKLSVHAGFETDQKAGLLIERLAQAVLFTSGDTHEGTSASSSRSARWISREGN